MKADYVAIANKYIADVLSGKVIACKFVKQACARQKNDLKRKNFKYVFNHERANHVCKFIELLPHVKGKWAGSNLKLEPWQIFILTTVFGWVYKQSTGLKTESGKEKYQRRFKKVYIEIPRKNAKSTLAAAIGLYCLAADGEGGAEVYSAATTRQQASIVFNDAQNMARRCHGLRTNLGVKVTAHAINVLRRGSSFKALSRESGGTLDGLNVHCAIIDELHAHKSRALVDVIESAIGARLQPLVIFITTAGFDRSGICYEQRTYVRKLLDGSAQDESSFGIIFTIDEGDDWKSQKAWRKANPNFGVSVAPDIFEAAARKAMTMAASQNNFLTKHLNVWVNADVAWLDMQAYQQCENKKLDIRDFYGQPVTIALDLASTKDIAAKIYLFNPAPEKYVVFGKYYVPQGAIENSDNSQYYGWEEQGFLTATEGNSIDQATIEADLLEDAQNFQIESLAYDRFQATYIIQRLASARAFPADKIVEYGQTVLNMSQPMKVLEGWVLDRRIEHNGCPVLTWMMSNVVAHTDAKENIYPRKEQEKNKIDGVVALIMAIGRSLIKPEETPSVYESRGLLKL